MRQRNPPEAKDKELTSSQGTEYAAFIASQVSHEHLRRRSIDDRATKLQQMSTVTLGLFVAALGLVLEADVTIPDHALKLFFGAVAVLLAAFFGGVVATYSRAYDVADTKTLDKMINERWGDTPITSRNMTAHFNVRTLDRLRPGNNRKATALTIGITLQGSGMLLVAATLGVFVVGG